MEWTTVVAVTLVTVMAKTVGGTVHQCLDDSNQDSAGDFSSDLTGITDFGFDLYRQLTGKDTSENFFFSPYSIWTALTLTYFGSAGNTKKQLEAALRVKGKKLTLRLWRSLGTLYDKRATSQPPYTFTMVNRAYFNSNLQLQDCITKILYKELQMVDFSDTYKVSRDVNEFVSSTTKGHITELVSPDDMVDALMVLVNAAYFKGTWLYQFDPSSTTTRKFFVSPGQSVDAPMMKLRTSVLRLAQSTELGAQILELPYAGNVISMLLLLPDVEGEAGFSNMVSALSGGSLSRVTSGWNSQNVLVELLLPKFKLEDAVSDELMEGLKNLGVRDLFEDSLANMTRFVVGKPLSVSKTVHKALVEVSEEGTEAAAATMAMASNAMSSKEDPPFQRFYCNKPFMFLIYDIQTKNVLFMGAYKSPPPP